MSALRPGSCAIFCSVIAVLAMTLPSAARAVGDAARGKLVVALAGGCGCHNAEHGPVGAGGRALKTPFGTFFATNITPDQETGIGAWSDEEIVAAIRAGYVRGVGVEAPVMPYYEYAGMADNDVNDVVAYLRTLPAVKRANTPHQIDLPFPRLAFRAWRLLFAPSASPPATAPAQGVERGRYLTNHVAICGDCHTPRNRFGALVADHYLAGAADGPLGERVPNITPDAETGIGRWDVDDITQLLTSGQKPDFDNVQGLMGEVIDGYGGGLGYVDAPPADLRAIAEYLKQVPAVHNKVKKE